MGYAHGDDGIDGTPALKVTQIDGSGSRTLDVEGRPASGSWRPDGRHIAFVGTRGGSTAYIADADGTNVRTLPIGPARAWRGRRTGATSPSCAMAETTGIGIADIAEEGAVSGLRHLGLDDRSTP